MSWYRVLPENTRNPLTENLFFLSSDNNHRQQQAFGMMASFSFSLCCGCPSPFLHSSSSSSYLISPHFASSSSSSSLGSRTLRTSLPLKPSPPSSNQLLCKAAEYVFPDPIPEFAESESNKFRTHLLEKLTKKKKDLFGDSIEEVVRVCTEILSNFLHTEYGGPGTLLVIPFIDMADTLNERGLPGGPQAARAAVIWAQKHIDKDWNEWNKKGKEDPK